MTAATIDTADRMMALLPRIFAILDAEQGSAIAAQWTAATPPVDGDGPLRALLAILGQQYDLLAAQNDALYDDQFIETCADWLIPYFGDLIGARIIDTGDRISARRQVADTIANRRAKGTAASLARLGGDVMNRPVEAVEYREHLVTTLHLDYPGRYAPMSADLSGQSGRDILLPNHIGQHSVELRDMRDGGRFAAPNIGVRVAAMQALPIAELVPTPDGDGSDGQYHIHPMRAAMPLWRRPVADNPAKTRLSMAEIAAPIALRHAVDYPALYYSDAATTRAVGVFINGALVPLAQICFCNLADKNGTPLWNRRGTAADLAKVRIDPELGRIALPASMLGVTADQIRMMVHYGAALPAGGGGHRVKDPLPANPATIGDGVTQAAGNAALAAHLGALAGQTSLVIGYGGTLTPPNSTALPPDSDIVIAADFGIWPALLLAPRWRFTGGRGSRVTLIGLRMFGGAVEVATDGLTSLTILDCTLVPGSASLTINDANAAVIMRRSLSGTIRMAEGAAMTLIDSFIDSGAPDTPAILGIGSGHGGILSGERSTILGDVGVLSVARINDCVLSSHPRRTTSTPSVISHLVQQGCVRYSHIPADARVPRRYRCYPNAGGDPAVQFASLTYGHADYGTLAATSPDAVLLGAEHGLEMGALNALSWTRRARIFQAELPEWTPFGMTSHTEILG